MEQIQKTLLFVLFLIVVLSLLVRTLKTGDDLPKNWLLFLGYIIGILFGLKEIKKRKNNKDKDKNGT